MDSGSDDQPLHPVARRPSVSRVLVAVEGPEAGSRTVETLLAEHLARLRPELHLEIRRDARSLLRTVLAHPESLDGYDAFVSVAASRRMRQALSGARIAEAVAARMPTLLVRLRTPGVSDPAGRHLAHSRSHAVNTLVLDADPDPAVSAGQIAVTLQALLLRRRRADDAASRRAPAPQDEAGTELVDRLAMRRLTQIVHLTQEAFDTTVAEINLVDATHVTTIATSGAAATSHLRADSLCDIAVRRTGLTVIPDTRLDPRARDRGPAIGPTPVRFYAAYPIESESGDLVGTLCIHDPEPHAPEEVDFGLLHDLALLVEGELIEARRRAG